MIGGLGHLAIQFAHKLGATVVAVSHSPSKKQQCQELGAKEFVCISDQTAVKSVSESVCSVIIVMCFRQVFLMNPSTCIVFQ